MAEEEAPVTVHNVMRDDSSDIEESINFSMPGNDSADAIETGNNARPTRNNFETSL